MVKKIFIILAFVWFAVLLFMPKQDLYFKMEEALEKQEIVLNEGTVESGLFSLSLKDVEVYVKGIKVATVEKIEFFTLLFFNRIELNSLQVDETWTNIAPKRIDRGEVTYTIVSPMKLGLDANGSFGTANGYLDLNASKIMLDFNGTKGLEKLKPYMKKDEKGWHYERAL